METTMEKRYIWRRIDTTSQESIRIKSVFSWWILFYLKWHIYYVQEETAIISPIQCIYINNTICEALVGFVRVCVYLYKVFPFALKFNWRMELKAIRARSSHHRHDEYYCAVKQTELVFDVRFPIMLLFFFFALAFKNTIGSVFLNRKMLFIHGLDRIESPTTKGKINEKGHFQKPRAGSVYRCWNDLMMTFRNRTHPLPHII